jgi:hypothetical protein
LTILQDPTAPVVITDSTVKSAGSMAVAALLAGFILLLLYDAFMARRSKKNDKKENECSSLDPLDEDSHGDDDSNDLDIDERAFVQAVHNGSSQGSSPRLTDSPSWRIPDHDDKPVADG